MTEPLDLDAIRARVAAASIGPWTAADDGLVWAPRLGDPVSGSALPEDAAFIAHARTDVPALLAEIERLTAELAEAHAKLNEDLASIQRWSRATVEARAERDKARWHQERCHAHHLAVDADLSRVRTLADEHVEHADGCGLLAGQILETLRAPGQDAASGRTDPAAPDATRDGAQGAPRAAEGAPKPPPDTSWLQTPEVCEGDRRRGEAADA